jgi:F0F1-type ATP synthase assembly protein I
MAVSIAAAVVIPLLGGLAVDTRLGTGPVGLLAGLGLGIAAGAAVVWSQARRYL